MNKTKKLSCNGNLSSVQNGVLNKNKLTLSGIGVSGNKIHTVEQIASTLKLKIMQIINQHTEQKH
jgi:hypothetical protein